MTGTIDMTDAGSRSPFAVRDFRMLWLGEAVSALGDQFVADLLGLVEGRQTSALDGADMDEHVLRAVIRLDEAKTLLRIEPFDFACRHMG